MSEFKRYAYGDDTAAREWMAFWADAVNGWIREYCERVPEEGVGPAMAYALTAGGKRLRPLLVLGAAEYLGVSPTELRPVALSIEFLHTYSLIHDDLPAMDNDDLRRGRPTVHRAYDEATAILAGDALLTEAFGLLAEAGASFSGSATARAVRRLSQAAGHQGLILGQALDLAGEGQDLDRTALERIHRNKTGALFQAAVMLPAILVENAAAERDLAHYGEHFGLAFQIVDDILNVVGDADVLGKPTGSDAARGKATYPALLGLETAQRLAEHERSSALSGIAGEESSERAKPLRYLADFAVSRHW